MESNIKIKKINPQATFYKATPDAVGYDLTCVDVGYKDGVGRLFLGVAIEPPPGMWFMCVPRSSFPKSGWIQANSVGIIDPDYRGEWIMNVMPLGKMLLLAHGTAVLNRSYKECNPIEIDSFIGTRVCQAIPMMVADPMKHLKIVEVDELGKTERGTGGFGSTGR